MREHKTHKYVLLLLVHTHTTHTHAQKSAERKSKPHRTACVNLFTHNSNTEKTKYDLKLPTIF